MIKRPSFIPLAMIICDLVKDERGSNKQSLIGLFDIVRSSKAPYTHPQLSVYVVITDVLGTYNCSLCFAKEATNENLKTWPGRITSTDPLRSLEVTFDITELIISEFGIYRFDFYCGDNLIISRRFSLEQREIRGHIT